MFARFKKETPSDNSVPQGLSYRIDVLEYLVEALIESVGKDRYRIGRELVKARRQERAEIIRKHEEKLDAMRNKRSQG